MADNNSRTFRSRTPFAEADSPELGLTSDPLAELARLIGQSDPVGERSRSARQPVTLGDAPGAAPPPASGPGWDAEDDYAEDDRYQQADTRSSPASRAHSASERDYDQEPEPLGRYSAPSVAFDDVRDSPAAEDDARYRDEFAPDNSDDHLSALAPQSDDDGYDTAEEWGDSPEDPAYADEDYADQAPIGMRRTGVIVGLAVLGLVVVGAGGALAYRTMFGGTLLPSLPPIIKASDGPNKIVPSPSSSQADASSPGGAGNGGAGEKLVSREEQPLNIQTPPNSTAPRVISTIPVLQGSGGGPQPSATASGWPPSPAPGGLLPGAGAASGPTGAIAPAPAAPAAPVAPPPAVSTAPKKIHTVVIRSDQPGGADLATAAPTPPVPASPSPPPLRTAHYPAPPAAKPPAREANGNAPLDLLHQQPGEALPPPSALPPPPQPQPAHVARAEVPETPMALGPGAPSASPGGGGGGYAVQVSSQRSDADARASFQSLRAKYPNELGGRQPIIRRADLGAKGTFYRAFVGPFASAEDAAAMCSRLKAAGGSCLVQRD